MSCCQVTGVYMHVNWQALTKACKESLKRYHYTLNKGEKNESVKYDACHLYPFDSRASSDMITENVEGFRFRGDFETGDEKKLEDGIRRGDKFNSKAEYSVDYIK